MKKLFLAFALVACFAVSALGQGSPPLRVKEADGSPNVSGVTTIVVSNGSITSVQGKTIYLTTGGGGGGGSPGGSSTQVQYNAAGSFGGISGFTSDGTNVTAGSGNLRATSPRITTGINDSNGNELILFTATGSAVNEITLANGATGSSPTITASGDDANVGINITTKGTGGVVLSNGTAANPTLRFTGDAANYGWYRSANTWTYSANGSALFALPASEIRITSGALFSFATGSAASTGPDAALVRAATNTVRLSNASTGAGSLIIGTSAGAIGTSGVGVLAFTLSTEPSTSPTDTTQLYYKDFAAGDGRLYLRNEASAAGSPVANLGDAQTFTGRITFSPGATVAGINVGSVAGNPSGPSNADLWYNTATNELYARINGANVALGSGGGGGITIGTTTITSGTNTRVLYNNAGVVGEYVITGTGNVVMSASPTLTGTVAMAAATASGTIVQTSASSAAFESGPNGSTNPVFRLVNSTASQATGLSITGNAAGSGATLTVLSSGTNEDLRLAPKGAANVVIAATTPILSFNGQSSIYGNSNDLNYRSGTSNHTFEGTGGNSFPTSGGYVLYKGAVRFYGPADGTLRITSSGGTGAASLLLSTTGVSTADAQLHSITTNATTNAITTGLILDQRSSGTPAAGLGLSSLYRLHSSTTTAQTAAVNNIYWLDATHASRSSVWNVQTVSNATTSERMIVTPRKALTDASAVNLFDATLASNSAVGGTIEATIIATDGTDYQSRSVVLTYQAVNKAGTITSSVTVASETAAVSSGTLTGTWTASNGSGKITIQLNADTSLTPTSFYVIYQVRPNAEQSVTPL